MVHAQLANRAFAWRPMTSPDPALAELPDRNEPLPIYVIRVKGCLDAASYSDWFGSMALLVDRVRGETVLTGPVTDQAELYGLLARLRGLALPLLSVTPAEPDLASAVAGPDDTKPADACPTRS